MRRLRRRGHHRADAAARGRPGPELHRGGWPAPLRRYCGLGAPWSSSRPPTRAPPRSWSARSSRRAPASTPASTSTSATAPSASTRATPTWTLVNTPKVVSGIDAGSPRARSRRFYDRLVDADRAGRLARRRPSWPSCSRTPSGTSTSPWSTSWRCSPTTSASTSGRRSTRPRPSRSASCAFTPGPGVGGHCLPIDPSYLSWRVQRTLGQTFRFVELANDINDHMPDYVVRRLVAALNRARHGRERLAGSCCSAWPTRRTPATPASRRPAAVASALLALGAEVRAADPHVVEAPRRPRVSCGSTLTAEELAARRRRRAARRPRRLRLRRSTIPRPS